MGELGVLGETLNTNSHRILMGIQLFCLSHEFYSMTDMADAFFCKMLECDLATIAVEIHTIIGCGISVSGECMVRTAGIVTGTLTGIGS